VAKQLFPTGSLYITPGALRACQSFPMPPDVLIVRHVTGDWGDVSPVDKAINVRSLQVGARIFSVYQYGEHRFYVITEADRGSTTILLAGEY
jgi:hypothetical protein